MLVATSNASEPRTKGFTSARVGIQVNDITERFALDSIDHHELLVLLGCRYPSCWLVSEDEIAFPAVDQHHLKIETRHGVIHRISRGEGLTDELLSQLLNDVKGELQDERVKVYARNILFASQPVKGAFRFRSIPLQILPPPANAPQTPYMPAQNPFVLEHPLRAYQTQEFGFRRWAKNAMEWTWILNVFVHGSIHIQGPRPRQMWASKAFGALEPPFWTNENYSVPDFEGLKAELSNVDAPPIAIIPAQSYYGDGRQRIDAGAPLDAMSLPDNLDELVEAVMRLRGEERRRFLRSALCIYMAREVWNSSLSSCFLACVQAMEILVEPLAGVPCVTCGKNTGPGPTKLLRDLVDRYRGDVNIDSRVLSKIYTARSSMVHGAYLFQMDEAPWNLGAPGGLASWGEREISDAALILSKTVLRNWLLNRKPSEASGAPGAAT